MREPELRALCAQRGITIRRRGVAYVLVGRGVSVLVTDLSILTPRDLEPMATQAAHSGPAISPENDARRAYRTCNAMHYDFERRHA